MSKLETWSPRRLGLVWVVGLTLQCALLVLPVWWTLSHVAEWRAAWQVREGRWADAELADSLSVAAQRATGAVRVGPAGDTVVALVRMPSGRPSPAAIRAASPSRVARVISAVYLGGIPVALVVLTVVWWRRRAARPAAPLSSGGDRAV